jgi:hypothetical protein
MLLAQAAEQGLQLGDGPIRGGGFLGEQVDQYAESPENAIGIFSSEISIIIGFLTVIGGLFFVIYFLIAAFDWLRAGTDKGGVEKAQQRMVNAAIGLMIMVAALGIVGVVGGVFGVELLNPAEPFLNILESRGN